MRQKSAITAVSPITFSVSALVAVGLIAFASIKPNLAASLFAAANRWITLEAGWFYLLSVAIFVIFLIGLAISPMGRIKLGPDDSEPDYGYGTWVAMLFSAGMGIGIVFYGVAEPITHFTAPPDAAPRSVQAARDAMEITFFHWGVHAWAIYGLLGLALAYFGYRRGQPLAIRSAFHPLLGDRINGPVGDFIDIFAVVGTLAGLATSLGLGVSQLNASMSYLFGLAQTLEMQLILIGIVTILSTITVATGLDNGIRRLSEGIILVSCLLMLLILVLGPTRFLLKALVENIGLYLNGFIARTFHIYAYQPTDWVGTWTLFYWGWWISWSPFVGMFVARISRGRTIRQFLIGVLFAPAGFSFIWFTIFGDLAIWLDINEANGAIGRTVAENMPIALFTVFDYLPASTLLAWMTGLLVVVYFVTASDAGALVVAMITADRDNGEEPALWLRVFWALVCGGFAACLLVAGGLAAVQTAAVIAALPLAIVMLAICFGLWKALSAEAELTATSAFVGPLIVPGGAIPWQRRLGAIVSYPTRTQVSEFIETTVTNALRAVEGELARRGLVSSLEPIENGVQLLVRHGDADSDFVYAVRATGHPIPAFALTDAARREGERQRYFRAEVLLTGARRGYNIYGLGTEQVTTDVINQYDRFRHRLHMTEAFQMKGSGV